MILALIPFFRVRNNNNNNNNDLSKLQNVQKLTRINLQKFKQNKLNNELNNNYT